MRTVKHFRRYRFFRTIDGKEVRDDLLFRSRELSKLSKKDEERLSCKYQIRKIIDFRSQNERMHAPDHIGENFEYYHIPLLKNEKNVVVTKNNRIDILKKNMLNEGGVTGTVIQYYKTLITDEGAQEGYRKALNILLNNDKKEGILYHCTQGKDRTGLFSAIILTILGVDKKYIMRDYMDYNFDNYVQNYGIAFAVVARYASFRKSNGTYAVLVAKRKYLNAAYDEAERVYGSFDKYIEKALGVTEEMKNKLRKLYLK